MDHVGQEPQLVAERLVHREVTAVVRGFVVDRPYHATTAVEEQLQLRQKVLRRLPGCRLGRLVAVDRVLPVEMEDRASQGDLLLARQRAFRRAPGLVADGRDMGTVVFPDAALKVFLTASVAVRAQRRYKQLIDKGNSANLAALSRDLEERDRRDAAREVAPLKPAADAVLIDSSDMTIDQVVDRVLEQYREGKKSGK